MVSGTGVSIKTIEALALGKPFVGTSKAFRGMPMDRIEKAGLRAHDTPREFADAIVDALSREKLASAASRVAYCGNLFQAIGIRLSRRGLQACHCELNVFKWFTAHTRFYLGSSLACCRETMKITVILCTFNRCHSLPAALDSVAVQLLPDSVSWEGARS